MIIIDISCLEKLTIGKYSMKGNELLMQSNKPLSGLELDMEQLRMLAIRQGALHRVSTAVLVNMPNVKKELDQQLLSGDDKNKPGFKPERNKYHIIHGSFRDLVNVYVDKTGDLEKTEAIGDARTRQKKEEITTTTIVKPEEQYSVLKVVDPENDHVACGKISGFFGNKEVCSTLRMIIFTRAGLSETTELRLTDMEELERVIIGDKCFLGVAVFHVQRCPQLRRMFIGDGSFTTCTECVIEDNAELLELQLGGNVGVSTPQQDETKKENTKNTTNSPGGVNEEKLIEQSKETKPDEPAEICKEPAEKLVLKLASCYYQKNSNE